MEHLIPYLKKLKKNNNRDWFEKHKADHDLVKEEFTAFISQVLDGLKGFDKELKDIEAKKTVFRIYRDVRFSKDKTPYKTHFGASINPGSKNMNTPGYYIHVEPGKCFIVAGIYGPETPVLNKIRQEIVYHLPEFKKILAEKNYKKYFGSLDAEEQTKNPPRGFDKESPAMEFLKYKSYLAYHEFDEKKILDKNFPKKIAEMLKVSFPLNKFLRRAMV
ncbi:MAG: DUF2461 domain-containing protein [Bacteroidia bacterium]|nr:DUF2461 domain-containing protein [Bacteroidia bacterium]